MTVTDAEFNDLEARVDELEELIVSSDQVSALAKLYDADMSSIQDQLDDFEDRIDTLESKVESFYQWRTNVRNDVRYEQATNTSGSTWTVPTAYDDDSPFLVFDGITRVLDSNITLSDPDNAEFTSSIALSGPVYVLYFRAFPSS